MPGRSLSAKAIGRSILPVARITRPARTRHSRCARPFSATCPGSTQSCVKVTRSCSQYPDAEVRVKIRPPALRIRAAVASIHPAFNSCGSRIKEAPKIASCSTRITRLPASASSKAACKPAGPPPTIRTSQKAARWLKRSGSASVGALPRPAALRMKYS